MCCILTLIGATLLYPLLVAVLAVGIGLAVNRASGSWLPGPLVPVVGMACMVAIGQITIEIAPLAPATLAIYLGVAAAGYFLCRDRVVPNVRALPSVPWVWATVATYLLAIAPVLLSGRPTLTWYLTDTTTATHLAGADYLLHHGRHFQSLSGDSSYALQLRAYFQQANYPSGAHVLLAASGQLLPIRLTWMYQPFMSILLASSTPSIYLLLHGGRSRSRLLGLAAVAATIPSLVYTLTLVGSIKEIAALIFIMGSGALAVRHPQDICRSARGVIPFGLIVGAGVSVVGAPFVAWGAAAALCIVGWIVVKGPRTVPFRRVLALAASGVIVAVISAPVAVAQIGTSVGTARGIATTADPGNLLSPLPLVQVFGVWLSAQYRSPSPDNARLTYALVGIVAFAAALGAFYLIRSRQYSLAAWTALLLLVWWRLSVAGTIWTDAKVLLLTSPVLAILAWSAVAGLLAQRQPWVAIPLAAVLALGVVYSAAEQYHATNLAPTARFDELAAIDQDFKGQGPALVTDFEEFAFYELRDLRPSSPGFAYKNALIAETRAPYGASVDPDALPLAAFKGQPLLITRRSPVSSRPPSMYALVRQGKYYDVWRRRSAGPSVLAHYGQPSPLSATAPLACPKVRRLAALAASNGTQLLVARRPHAQAFPASAAAHSAGWLDGPVLSLYTPGELTKPFRVARAARYDIWISGEIGRRLEVSVDGRAIGRVGQQTGGSPNFLLPLQANLSSGAHVLRLVRPGGSLAPGDAAPSSLDAVVISVTGSGLRSKLSKMPVARYRDLCRSRGIDWVEAVDG